MLSPLENLSVFKGYEILQEGEGRTIRRYLPRQTESVSEESRLKPGFVAQTEAFLSGDPGPGAGLEDALRLMRFIDEIRACA